MYFINFFLIYRFVSITLVFLNKSLLSGTQSVDAPLFITCFQCAITAAVCYGNYLESNHYDFVFHFVMI